MILKHVRKVKKVQDDKANYEPNIIVKKLLAT